MGATLTVQTQATPAQDQRFRQVLAAVLGEEGGLSDTPGDRGGLTNFGVTLRFLVAQGAIDPAIRARFDLNHDGDLDGADIRLLTPEEAGGLYERCLWIRTGYCNLPAPIDGMLFDQAVNCGVVGANKLLQRAINSLSRCPITVDGVLGDQTLIALRVCLRLNSTARVVRAFRQAAMDHYRAICVADPEQLRFLAGWLNRAEALGNV